MKLLKFFNFCETAPRAKPTHFERLDSSDSSGRLIIDEAHDDAGNVNNEGEDMDAYDLADSFIDDTEQGEEEEDEDEGEEEEEKGETSGETEKDEDPMETEPSEVQPSTAAMETDSSEVQPSISAADVDSDPGVDDPTPKKKRRQKISLVETPKGIKEQFGKAYKVSNDVLCYPYKT